MMSIWPPLTFYEAGIRLIDCVHKTPAARDSGYPYVAIPQMKSGRIDFTDARRISHEDFVEWTKKARPKAHDVVLSRRTNPGVTATVGSDLDFALGQNLVLLRADGTMVSPAFLRWLVLSPAWWAEIEKYNNVGAVFDSLKCADVPKFRLPIPPKSVQVSISELLGSMDEKIALNRRMNATLEAMAQAIFRDWFVEFGPVRRKLAGETEPVAIMGGLTPDPARAAELATLFPARLDEHGLPEGWAAGAAGDLIEFNPKEPLKRGVPAPYSDMSSLPTGGSSADLPIMREFGSGMRFRNGDALLARITPCLENGKTALVDFLTEESPVGWGSTEFIVHRARPGTPQALPYLLCRNDDYRSYAIHSMTGTSGRQRAQVGSLEAWPMAIPTGPVLEAFSDFVDAIFARISASSRENRTLAEASDYLLPRLMSGQVRANLFNTESAAA